MVHYAPVNGLEIRAITFNGFKPEQQDSYVTCKNHNETFVAGIFDGHGSYGAKVSETLKTIAPGILNACENLETKSIEEAFTTIANNLERQLGTNILAKSGSTAVVVLQDMDYFYIAHCGDARAVWGFQKQDQTFDHRNRNIGDPNKIPPGTLEITRKGGILTITKTFGDLDFKKYGLHHTPSIIKIKKTDFPTLLLGCDGVFDYASKQYNEYDEQTFNNEELWTIVQLNSEKLELRMLRLAAQVILSDQNFQDAKQDPAKFLPKEALHAQSNFIDTLFANYILYPMLLIQNWYKFRGIEKYANKRSAADFQTEDELRTFVQNWSWLLHDNTTAMVIKVKPGATIVDVQELNLEPQTSILLSFLMLAVVGYGFYTWHQNR